MQKCCTSLPVAALAAAPPPVSALAIVNARIWTGDARRPWADALLVREAKKVSEVRIPRERFVYEGGALAKAM